jgi:thiazole synthase ThiGH ThiG subunit
MTYLPQAGVRATWLLAAASILAAGLTICSTTQADALAAVQVLREGGCGGLMPAAAPLRRRRRAGSGRRALGRMAWRCPRPPGTAVTPPMQAPACG